MLSATSVAMRPGARRVPRLSTSIAPTLSPNRCLLGLSSTTSTTSTRGLAALPTPICTYSTRNDGVRQHRRGYATTTNPNPPFGNKYASNEVPSRIALIGARGYTGQALIDLFNKHPFMDLRHVSSRELAGQQLQGYTKRNITYEHLSPDDVAQLDRDGQVDCWVMALPNGVCKPYIEALDQIHKDGKRKSVIIDLSADHRFDNSWSYGLPELTKRSEILQSTRISNPGCFATAAQLSIAPLIDHLGGEPVIFGASGYSGAGTKPSPKNDVNLLKDNLIPYSLTGHIHEHEISHHLGLPAVTFIPHVASWFRSILLTINIPLNKSFTSRNIRHLYQERYAREPLVKIVGEAPLVRSISTLHHCEIGGFATNDSGNRVVICSTIDNINKGASTQSLQNMNLALGYAEFEGIPLS
ncbi:acetylglutamate kinase [Xylaria castorea]|nr:acetylglutamate kinase [Xylaria castorea]